MLQNILKFHSRLRRSHKKPSNCGLKRRKFCEIRYFCPRSITEHQQNTIFLQVLTKLSKFLAFPKIIV